MVPFSGFYHVFSRRDFASLLVDLQTSTIVGFDLESAIDVTNTAAEVGEFRRIHPPIDGEVLSIFGDGLLTQHNVGTSMIEC